jgi:hypothetical protein
MAITTKERTELRTELVGQGYSWNYIDEWQPKVTLYRHMALTNPSGETVSPVGVALENLPGNPDYVSRKARLGLFPWPPGNACTCRWCVRIIAEQEKATRPAATTATPRAAKTGPYYNPNS